jgi:hypothetical protein
MNDILRARIKKKMSALVATFSCAKKLKNLYKTNQASTKPAKLSPLQTTHNKKIAAFNSYF